MPTILFTAAFFKFNNYNQILLTTIRYDINLSFHLRKIILSAVLDKKYIFLNRALPHCRIPSPMPTILFTAAFFKFNNYNQILLTAIRYDINLSFHLRKNILSAVLDKKYNFLISALHAYAPIMAYILKI